jgi:hypothetical protein
VIVSLLLLAQTALASDAAVLPFMAWGLDNQSAQSLSSQVAQELDYLGAYTAVFPLDIAPPGLNAACLASTDCMAGVANTVDSAYIIAGQVSDAGGNYDIFMVLYDTANGFFLRQHRFTMSPASVADGLGAEVRFLVTGERAASNPTATADDFTRDDLDYGFDNPIDVPASTMDLSGSDPLDLDDYEADRDEPIDEFDYGGPEDLDSDRGGGDKPRMDSVVSITGRVGYARYQDLNFVAWGGEVGIEALQPVRLNIGVNGQSLPLVIEGTENEFGVPETEWRSLLAFNVGAVYVFYTDTLTPYAGADLTFTAYTSKFNVAPGVRLRGGFDYMASEVFGINIDLAAGMMFGTDTTGKNIDLELNTMGFSPQITLGTVLAF